jgi:ferredoxin-like protein FixX
MKGTASTHSKFLVVRSADYRFLPSIILDPKLDDKVMDTLMSACHCNVFEMEEGGKFLINPRNCIMCRKCVQLHVTLGMMPNHYEFTVEGIGIKPAARFVEEALQILSDRAGEMRLALPVDIP